ncbi:MAG TPA: DedA family protein [Syntrophobacter fumaroxidans]|nr:DedA family protein [Syntrophobacter fumaroxidans]
MLTEMVSNFAIRCLETTGYLGAAFLMALESMIAPIPSEAVMPFVGFLVADGKWNIWLAVLATSAGSIIGSLASYLMGYHGGKPLVLKVGKYLLLDEHDLERTESFFNRRSGTLTIFVSRFVPVVRHLISIPAGTGKMPLGRFLIATLVGATLWNSFLLGCGMVLREHWSVVQTYSHQVDIVVVLALLAGAAWFVRARIGARRRKAMASSSEGE